MARGAGRLAAALCLLVLVHIAWGSNRHLAQYGQGDAGACPTTCPSLPERQRRASALAVSLVAFVGCDGNVEGAARALLAAASDGDTEAFSAGLAAGAASLTGRDHAKGQMAEALTQTFTVADGGDKAKAVASAVGGALEAMGGSGGAQAAMMAEVVDSLNDLADNGACARAAASAFEMYRTLKLKDKKAGGAFLARCALKGRACWTRRLAKLATSFVFNRPPPVSPCSRYVREASAISVSLISASSCGLPNDKQLDAAAYALVSAATRDGCSFASAVASASLSGVANSSQIISVYQSAIPQARAAGPAASAALAGGFARALYEVTGLQGDASGLLGDMVAAIGGTVRASGCGAAREFATGVFQRLLDQDPSNREALLEAFGADPTIARCAYGFEAIAAGRGSGDSGSGGGARRLLARGGGGSGSSSGGGLQR